MPTESDVYVCYLDFDGVLHHENVWYRPGRGIYIDTPGYRLFEWEPILLRLLEPYPKVKIVLSTSWVRARRFSFAKKQLHPALQTRVIGATFHSRFMNVEQFAAMPRGLQIWGDVYRRKPADWFAVDDDHFGWPAWCRDKLIQTAGDQGLSEPAVQAAIQTRLAGWAEGLK